MPLYEYACASCGKREEVLQRLDSPPPVCEQCKYEMDKQISRTNFSLKGGGWYKDGYSNPATKDG